MTQTGAAPLQIGKREIRPDQVHMAIEGLAAQFPSGQPQEWMRALILRLVRELDANRAEVTGTLRNIFDRQVSEDLRDVPAPEVKSRSLKLIRNMQSTFSKLSSAHVRAGKIRSPLATFIRFRVTHGFDSRAPEFELQIMRPGSGARRQQAYTIRLAARWVFLYGRDYVGQSPRDEIHHLASSSDILDALLLALGPIGRAAIARSQAEDVVENTESPNIVRSGLKIEILRRFLLLLTPRLEPHELRFFVTSLFDVRTRDDILLDELLWHAFTPYLLAALVESDGESLTGEVDEIRWRLVHAEHLDLLDRMLIFKMCQRNSPPDVARYRSNLMLPRPFFRLNLVEEQEKILGLEEERLEATGLTEFLKDKLDAPLVVPEVMQAVEREIVLAGGPAAWVFNQWSIRLPM